jgi:hypothetical protein
MKKDSAAMQGKNVKQLENISRDSELKGAKGTR